MRKKLKKKKKILRIKTDYKNIRFKNPGLSNF